MLLKEIIKKDQKEGIDAACIEYFDEFSLKVLKDKYPQLPKNKKAAVYFDQNIFKEAINWKN